MTRLPTLAEIEDAAEVVYRHMPATPQYRWGLLSERLGAEVWLKHENHTPVGAFKIRGGITYVDQLRRRGDLPRELISATRGNHGQSIGWAARANGVGCTVVVPHGNSVEKNAAMKSLGVNLVEHGDDFTASAAHAAWLAAERGAHLVPSFHADLLRGVSTYWWELLRAAPLDVVYVPIGLGSGAVSALAVVKALGVDTEVVGVVSGGARCYALSLAFGVPVEAPVTTVIADGMAVRAPHRDALALLAAGLSRVVEVTDDEVAEAMRWLFADTHNVAEGAGAAALAAAAKDGVAGRRVGVPITGGNVDTAVFAGVLAGRAPGTIRPADRSAATPAPGPGMIGGGGTPSPGAI